MSNTLSNLNLSKLYSNDYFSFKMNEAGQKEWNKLKSTVVEMAKNVSDFVNKNKILLLFISIALVVGNIGTLGGYYYYSKTYYLVSGMQDGIFTPLLTSCLGKYLNLNESQIKKLNFVFAVGHLANNITNPYRLLSCSALESAGYAMGYSIVHHISNRSERSMIVNNSSCQNLKK